MSFLPGTQSPRAPIAKEEFYRPSSNDIKKGAAMQLQLKLNQPHQSNYDVLILEMANQKTLPQGAKKATFKWTTKEDKRQGLRRHGTFFLKTRDIAQLLLVLEKKQAAAKIYHQIPKQNSILSVRYDDKSLSDRATLWVGLSIQLLPDKRQALNVNIGLDIVDQMIMKTICQQSLFYISQGRNIVTAPGA